MAERTTSYYNIHQIVKMFLNQRKEKSLANYEGYLQIAMELYSDMNIFTLNTIEVSYVSVNPDTNTALLPVDLISYTKIGFRKCGKTFTLTLNNDIALPPPESICPVAVEDVCETTTAEGGYYFLPHYRYGAYIDNLYGIGGGFNTAYYRVDMSTRTIILNGRVPDNELIIEYKSSGIKAGNLVIPRQAAQAIISGLHWKTIEYDSRYSLSDKQRKHELHLAEVRKVAMLENSFSGDELMDVLWSTYSQSPKR